MIELRHRTYKPVSTKPYQGSGRYALPLKEALKGAVWVKLSPLRGDQKGRSSCRAGHKGQGPDAGLPQGFVKKG